MAFQEYVAALRKRGPRSCFSRQPTLGRSSPELAGGIAPPAPAARVPSPGSSFGLSAPPPTGHDQRSIVAGHRRPAAAAAPTRCDRLGTLLPRRQQVPGRTRSPRQLTATAARQLTGWLIVCRSSFSPGSGQPVHPQAADVPVPEGQRQHAPVPSHAPEGSHEIIQGWLRPPDRLVEAALTNSASLNSGRRVVAAAIADARAFGVGEDRRRCTQQVGRSLRTP